MLMMARGRQKIRGRVRRPGIRAHDGGGGVRVPEPTALKQPAARGLVRRLLARMLSAPRPPFTKLPGPGRVASRLSAARSLVAGLLAPALPVVVLAVLWTGCEESLPPRVDPPEVLHPDVGMVGDIISLHGYGGDDTLFTGGNVRLSMTNVHDEVLSEDALIRATVTLSLSVKPDSVRTLQLGRDDLVAPPGFFGPVLTLGVHEHVELMGVWDQRTDNGTPFWTFPTYHEAFDSKGRTFFQSDTISMVVTTSMQVFERVQPLEIIKRELPVVYELYDLPLPPPPN